MWRSSGTDQVSGGIKTHNALRVLHGAVSTTHHALDGLAVVSDIYGSTTPKVEAEKLASIVRSFKAARESRPVPRSLAHRTASDYTASFVVQEAAALLDVVRQLSPLVHQVSWFILHGKSEPLTSCKDHKQRGYQPIRKRNSGAWGKPDHGDCAARDGRLSQDTWSIVDQLRNCCWYAGA